MNRLTAIVVLPLILSAAASGAALPGGWEQVGTGATPTQSALNGIVLALNTDNPGVMYAGGNFTDAGGDPNADYIARWDGKTWKALGASRLNGQVTAIAYRNGKVYAGGTFNAAGGDANLGFTAVWDGTKWSQVCKPKGPRGNVHALQISGSTLYIGGSFQDGAGIPEADYMLACDLNTGAAHALVSGYTSSVVYGLAFDKRGTLYAGGGFGDLDGVKTADYVAAFSGGKWQGLGSGTGTEGGAVTSWVRSLTSDGTNEYIGGDFTNAAGIPQADNIAKWNGSAWSALGSNAAGTNGIFPDRSSVYAMLPVGSRLFVGGAFANANGNPLSDNLVVFDGKTWEPVGSDGSGNGALNTSVHALAVFGGKLYAGGNFTSVGGVGGASFLVSYPLAGAPPGGGGAPPTTTTTGGAAPPATGTATGTVTVNGTPFTSGRVPYNTIVDVTRGRLVLRTDTGTLTVTGAGGITAAFVLVRGTDRGRSIVELRLAKGDFAVCPKRKTKGVARAAATTVRQLWGDGKGRFRTRGRYAAATVRGTRWLTADRCDGTQTRVTQGVVQVADLPRSRQVTVRAGGSYLARP